MLIDPLPPETVVAVVNGWGSVPRQAGARAETPALPDQAQEDGLKVADLERIADTLFPVFASLDTAERVAQLAEILERTKVRPAVRVDGDSVTATWVVAERRNAVLAAAALALRQQLAEHEPSRVGTCAADGCADVYIDVSARAHRRFCSVTCQNRTRVAAFRRRRTT